MSEAIEPKFDDGELRVAELIERDAWADLFAAAPPQVVKALGLASADRDGALLLGCRAIPIVELNRALALGTEAGADDEAVEAATSWLDSHAAPGWAVQLAPTAVSGDLGDRLRRRGLTAMGAGWAKFVRASATPPVECSIEDVRLVEPDDARVYGQAVCDGFGFPPLLVDWFATLVGRPGWSCFLGYVDGVPAGAGALFQRDEAGWIGIAATIERFRGRGVQRAIIAARIARAAHGGAILVTSETGQPSAPEDGGASYRNLHNAGFSQVYVRQNLGRDEERS